MLSRKPIFQKPVDDILYPVRNKNGEIETLVNPNIDTALTTDTDSKTNVVYNRYHHLPLETQRQKLPVFQYRNHILYLLEKYQTLILIGETGCGKSTQVPQYVYEVGHKVCVTQPRVTACVSLACRVAEERGATLGEDVGYAAAMTSCRTPDTGIVFMTEGVLLREMFASPLLMQYSCIVLDEVHERSQMTDVLMGLLKKIAKKRKNLKIVVSSATMDAEFLKDFFNLGDKNSHTDTSVIMSMQGRTHPIDVFYVEEPVADYVKATADTVIKIHENQPFGDILAFLTSQEEILAALDTLQIYAEENNEKNKYRKSFSSGIQAANLSVLPMYGSLPLYRQIKVFQMGDKNVRKVILATNIAETSVTIPGIVYVIDSGFHRLPYFDPVLGVECMSVCPVSRHNATQRAGRAGRVARGMCFRLYTEAEHEKLPESVPPEMSRSDLSSLLLQLKALGIHNLLRFTFPTPPPAKSLLSGLETLYALNAIDKAGNLTESVGNKMAELPLKPMCAKMLCNSGEFGCVDEVLSIVAMLQVEGVFARQVAGKDKMTARAVRRNNFEVLEGDLIMYLNVFESYSKVRNTQRDEKLQRKACKAWCQKMFVNYRVMEKACEIRKSLEKLIKDNFQIENKAFEGLDLGTAKSRRVMKCVVSGLFPQAASLGVQGFYRGIRGAKLHISPDSCLFHVQQPTWVVFASVQSTGDKVFMREMMTIEKEWLLEIAPHYYTHI
ncbi:probable ATP-dependent RNA helicase DHX35 isoform X1 [Pieris brassicae]|uniref:probable ATP-dependent RNA helicase DHX35 isoform X1 n=2 Tax=Pieris brassicae TaxID=7116 RepID=UPI001E65E6E4|nr:probable ATP-dependent RNA helicase DHX35 isoform X1 [Pieris brassicae]XP_045533658.1 probable ATP-dependent RNA helicase DHX35 isoform X1 [Pieris brassicae]